MQVQRSSRPNNTAFLLLRFLFVYYKREALNSMFFLLVGVAVQLNVVFYDKYMGEMSISPQRGSRCPSYSMARITVAF